MSPKPASCHAVEPAVAAVGQDESALRRGMPVLPKWESVKRHADLIAALAPLLAGKGQWYDASRKETGVFMGQVIARLNEEFMRDEGAEFMAKVIADTTEEMGLGRFS